MKIAIARRAAQCLTTFALKGRLNFDGRVRSTFDLRPSTFDQARSSGRDISPCRRWPQHGFHDPPDAVLVAKIMRQRQINALLVHEAELRLLLPDELLDSRAIVVAKDDELAFYVD